MIKLLLTSSSVPVSEKQLEFPSWIFPLSKELLIVLEILTGHFSNPELQLPLPHLSCQVLTSLGERDLNRSSFIISLEPIHGPREGHKPWLCPPAQDRRKALETDSPSYSPVCYLKLRSVTQSVLFLPWREHRKLFCNNSKANDGLPTVTPISEIMIFSDSSKSSIHLNLMAPYQAPPFWILRPSLFADTEIPLAAHRLQAKTTPELPVWSIFL